VNIKGNKSPRLPPDVGVYQPATLALHLFARRRTDLGLFPATDGISKREGVIFFIGWGMTPPLTAEMCGMTHMNNEVK
jgi:hypothetical protein